MKKKLSFRRMELATAAMRRIQNRVYDRHMQHMRSQLSDDRQTLPGLSVFDFYDPQSRKHSYSSVVVDLMQKLLHKQASLDGGWGIRDISESYFVADYRYQDPGFGLEKGPLFSIVEDEAEHLEKLISAGKMFLLNLSAAFSCYLDFNSQLLWGEESRIAELVPKATDQCADGELMDSSFTKYAFFAPVNEGGDAVLHSLALFTDSRRLETLREKPLTVLSSGQKREFVGGFISLLKPGLQEFCQHSGMRPNKVAAINRVLSGEDYALDSRLMNCLDADNPRLDRMVTEIILLLFGEPSVERKGVVDASSHRVDVRIFKDGETVFIKA